MTTPEFSDPPKPAKPKCDALRRQGDEGARCTQPAGWGTDHPGFGRCKHHGGSSPNGRKAAYRERDEAEVEKARRAIAELAQVNYHPDPVGNPLEELAKMAGEAVRWKNICAAFVADLNQLRYRAGGDQADYEQIRGEVTVYERAMDRAERVLVSIARLNIDERLARVDEKLADLIVSAVQGGLTAAGVTGDQAKLVELEVARRLRRGVRSAA